MKPESALRATRAIHSLFRLVLPIVAGVLLGTQALAASFDCAKARRGMETLVCGDPRLSSADESLAAAYRAALARTSSKPALVHLQREWLASDDVAGCADASCLLKAYQAREQLLGRVVGDEASSPWSGIHVRHVRGKIDPSATLVLQRLAGKAILVSGTATWTGALPGQVNTGEMAGEAAIAGNRATFEADGCRGVFSLAHGRLVVESSDGCGGLNVTFAGEYRRR